MYLISNSTQKTIKAIEGPSLNNPDFFKVLYKKELAVKEPVDESKEESSPAFYDVSHLQNLDRNAIKNQLHAALNQYKDIPKQCIEKSILIVAFDPTLEYEPVFVLFTCHGLTIDPMRIFGEKIDTVLGQVSEVFTEVELDLAGRSEEDYYKERGADYFLDKLVAQRAFKKGKQLKALENDLVREVADEEAVMTKKEEKQESVSLFSKTIVKKPTKINNITDASIAYFSEVYQTSFLNYELDSKDLRNLFWMQNGLLKNKKPRLVVCGARHQHGRFGLPSLFAAAGREVVILLKPSHYLGAAAVAADPVSDELTGEITPQLQPSL